MSPMLFWSGEIGGVVTTGEPGDMKTAVTTGAGGSLNQTVQGSAPVVNRNASRSPSLSRSPSSTQRVLPGPRVWCIEKMPVPSFT